MHQNNNNSNLFFLGYSNSSTITIKQLIEQGAQYYQQISKSLPPQIISQLTMNIFKQFQQLKKQKIELVEKISDYQMQLQNQRSQTQQLKQYNCTLQQQCENIRNLLTKQQYQNQRKYNQLSQSSINLIQKYQKQLQKQRGTSHQLTSLIKQLKYKSTQLKKLQINLFKLQQQNQQFKKYKQLNSTLNKQFIQLQKKLLNCKNNQKQYQIKFNNIQNHVHTLVQKNQQLQFIVNQQIPKIKQMIGSGMSNDSVHQRKRRKKQKKNSHHLKQIQTNFNCQFMDNLSRDSHELQSNNSIQGCSFNYITNQNITDNLSQSWDKLSPTQIKGGSNTKIFNLNVFTIDQISNNKCQGPQTKKNALPSINPFQQIQISQHSSLQLKQSINQMIDKRQLQMSEAIKQQEGYAIQQPSISSNQQYIQKNSNTSEQHQFTKSGRSCEGYPIAIQQQSPLHNQNAKLQKLQDQLLLSSQSDKNDPILYPRPLIQKFHTPQDQSKSNLEARLKCNNQQPTSSIKPFRLNTIKSKQSLQQHKSNQLSTPQPQLQCQQQSKQSQIHQFQQQISKVSQQDKQLNKQKEQTLQQNSQLKNKQQQYLNKIVQLQKLINQYQVIIQQQTKPKQSNHITIGTTSQIDQQQTRQSNITNSSNNTTVNIPNKPLTPPNSDTQTQTSCLIDKAALKQHNDKQTVTEHFQTLDKSASIQTQTKQQLTQVSIQLKQQQIQTYTSYAMRNVSTITRVLQLSINNGGGIGRAQLFRICSLYNLNLSIQPTYQSMNNQINIKSPNLYQYQLNANPNILWSIKKFQLTSQQNIKSSPSAICSPSQKNHNSNKGNTNKQSSSITQQHMIQTNQNRSNGKLNENHQNCICPPNQHLDKDKFNESSSVISPRYQENTEQQHQLSCDQKQNLVINQNAINQQQKIATINEKASLQTIMLAVARSRVGKISNRVQIPNIVNIKTSPTLTLNEIISKNKDNHKQPKQFYIISALLQSHNSPINDQIILWREGIASLKQQKYLIMGDIKKYIYDPVNWIMGNCEIIINKDGQSIEIKRSGKKCYFVGNLGDFSWKVVKVQGYGVY